MYIIATSWSRRHVVLAAIRRRVFIEEQQVPEALEWDGEDETARHFLAVGSDGRYIGCARLLTGGKVGRMAVLPEYRRQGIGAALLAAALVECLKQGWQQVAISAQTHAIPFYEKYGFVVCSDIYMDAGIPHRDMVLSLTD